MLAHSFMRSFPLAVTLFAALSAAACAAPTDAAEGEPDVEATADELSASQLAGEYQLGRGMFRTLSLKRERDGGRTKNTFTAEQVVVCVRAPCPVITLTGKWYAARDFLQLSPDTSPRVVFKTKLAGKELTLSNAQGVELAKLTKVQPRSAAVAAMLASRGIGKISLDFPDGEADRQAAAHPGSVSFEAALEKALDSFLTDSDDPESPLGLVSDIDSDDSCKRRTDQATLKCYLDDPQAELGMLRLGDSAEHGEKVSDYWIFTVSLPHLSDHGHWAIVDRKGREATYNYGFN